MLMSAIGGLTRVANSLAIAANVAGTLTVLMLVVILNVDVIARGFFNAPLKGTYEIVQLSVVFIVFLQLADVVRVDHLTRSDGFLNLLHSKRPNLTANLRRINNAVSAIFMGLIASGSALAGLIFVLKVNTAQDRPQLVRAPELDDLNKSGPNT